MSLARIAIQSPIGQWILEGDSDGLSRIYLPNERARPTSSATPRPVSHAARQLEQYFAGKRTNFEVDLHQVGTDFQNDVWNALVEIPYGEIQTYADIAARVGRPNAYRAVGNANGKNPWPIVVPCHRVVATNGIGGYAGGLDVKRFLLHLEGVQ